MTTKDPTYLFVLSPPFSGTTLLWKVLRTSPAVSALPKEGQHIDGTDEQMRGEHWNPEVDWDWSEISEVWHRHWDATKPVLLEKSPPNILRGPSIQKQFEPASFLLMMRNPYAFIEGVERRENDMGFEQGAKFWLTCARAQRRNLEALERTHMFSYEELTESTEETLNGIVDFMPVLEGFDLGDFETTSFLGKRQKIHNMNRSKINRLGPRALSKINAVLSEQEALVETFGYELVDPSLGRILTQLRTRLGHLVLRTARYRGIAPDFVVKPIERLVFRFTR